jgi:hypothetical protein
MASRVEEKREVCPNRRISPRSAGKWPETMWEKLDLPAPLAPTRAWISPWQRPRKRKRQRLRTFERFPEVAYAKGQ